MAKPKTWEEYKAECEAVAKDGIAILGFLEPWQGSRSKLVCYCRNHGKWDTTAIDQFRAGVSCPLCARKTTAEKLVKSNVKNWEFYKIKIEKLLPQNLKLVCFISPYRGRKTKIRLKCKDHGMWDTTTIGSFLQGTRCKVCNPKGTQKDCQELIKKFLSTGKFKKGTKFWKIGSYKLKGDGTKRSGSIFNYYCPVCSEDQYVTAGLCSGVFEGNASFFIGGGLSCRCSKSYRFTTEQWEFRLDAMCQERGFEFEKFEKADSPSRSKIFFKCKMHGLQKMRCSAFVNGQGCSKCAGNNQKEAYINLVYDMGIKICIKFGIANSCSRRLTSQNYRNLFKMKQIHIFKFPSVQQCKDAEKACKDELQCGILSSRELKDGWTETTSILNMDKIIEIYERFGGVLIKA